MSEEMGPPSDSHQPDTPFGCPAGWGPRIAAHPDGQVHICNRDDGHRGRHKCKCGTTHAE
jgi:hypothetical protein